MQILSVKLTTLWQQKELLENTIWAFTAGCNFVAEFGRKHGITQQWSLHQACYPTIRSQFGLPANLAIRAIARAASIQSAKSPTNSFPAPLRSNLRTGRLA